MKMDYSFNVLALEKQDEVEGLQKTIAKEQAIICKQSEKRNGVHTGLLMKSSILKALDLSIDFCFEDES